MARRKEEFDYFEVLVSAVRYANEAAERLMDLMKDYQDVERKAREIHDLEHTADHECHRLYAALNVAFITPIDREDIYALIKAIDDITDVIEDVASRFDMFHITSIRPDAVPIGQLILKATGRLTELMEAFRAYKKNRKQIHELIKDVNSIEEEGDRQYRKAVKTLFCDQENILEIIKWKDILDDMENVLDACEDVADIVEGVVMKNS
ncbi:MAG: DUF47 domain-containing protein [Clostridia bacterium]|nr:DUF47 domain-containing protein [Clostridia bacterium]